MDEYNLLVNKKPHRVKLPDLGKKTAFGVEVNGKSTEVELSEGISHDKPFFIKVGGKPYRVELDRREIGGSVTVRINNIPYLAQLENKNSVIPQAFKPSLPSVEKKFVKAPALDKGAIAASMPGKVVLLRVNVGEPVRVGDVLLVLESMKMENEIASPISGIIKEVKVSEGAAVNLGEIMLIVSKT